MKECTSMNKCVISGIMLLFILISLHTVTAGQTDGSNRTGNLWNGTWVDDYYTLTIQQEGSDILGSYLPTDAYANDPGSITGTVSDDGRVLSGRWVDSGVLYLNISDDNQSISGVAMVNPANGSTESLVLEFNATRSGEISDPENLWTADWIAPRKTYTLVQNGSSLSGEDHPVPGGDDEDGVLEGTVSDDGRSVTLNWTEAGDISFILSDDASVFNGTYTVEKSSSHETLYWNMTKNP